MNIQLLYIGSTIEQRGFVLIDINWSFAIKVEFQIENLFFVDKTNRLGQMESKKNIGMRNELDWVMHAV